MAEDELDTDALLKDLEARASSSPSSKTKPSSDDDEDLEAFLRGLEGEDYSPPVETATAEPDPIDAKFDALEEAPDAPMEKVDSKAGKKKAKKKKKGKPEKQGEVQVVERGESTGLKVATRVLKWTVVLIPALAAWWILGAYLSSWVSAGWLILTLATVLVLGLPLAIWLGLKRGRYGWWTAGVSALMAVGLVAPLVPQAGTALAKYGHWPASAAAEIGGLDPDSAVVRINATVAGWVSGLIYPTQEEQPALELGSDQPLGDVAAPEETAPEETAPEETAPEETAPEETAPEETAPEGTAPEETTPEGTAPEETAPEEMAPEETAPAEGEPTAE